MGDWNEKIWTNPGENFSVKRKTSQGRCREVEWCQLSWIGRNVVKTFMLLYWTAMLEIALWCPESESKGHGLSGKEIELLIEWPLKVYF